MFVVSFMFVIPSEAEGSAVHRWVTIFATPTKSRSFDSAAKIGPLRSG
jgi:hypothetical protein